MSAATIRKKIRLQLERDLRSYAHLAADWHRHHSTCPLCRPVRAGASRQCAVGRQLIQEARAAKWAVNLAGEEVVNVLGKAAAEEIANSELTSSFRPVPG